MTLYELLNGCEVLGAVRVYAWDDSCESEPVLTVLFETDQTDELGPCDLIDALGDREVRYIYFADNVLHIEVSNK